MNNYNKVLDALDGIFGFNDQLKSTFRRVRQYFDERTNEQVVIIEYRVRRGNAESGHLIRSINAKVAKSRAR